MGLMWKAGTFSLVSFDPSSLSQFVSSLLIPHRLLLKFGHSRLMRELYFSKIQRNKWKKKKKSKYNWIHSKQEGSRIS